MTTLQLAPASGAQASHLAFALLWLPRQRRHDAMVFYRFCRMVDDIADEPGRTEVQKHRLLQEWMDAIRDGLLPELEDIVRRYDIERTLLAEIVRGCEMDISSARYLTIHSLENYCWRVACAVGLVSIRIFGCHDLQSPTYAENLGHALQLTNILRDVSEDAQAGRIYLPIEDLERFGVSEDSLLAGCPGDGFLPLMRFEAERARRRFAAAVPPRSDSRALLPAEIMRAIYLKILDRLETQDFPVFKRRVRLNRFEKIATALGISISLRFRRSMAASLHHL